MKIFKILLILLLLPIHSALCQTIDTMNGQAITQSTSILGQTGMGKVFGFSITSGCSYATEDFSDASWVETDDSSRITKTDSDTITWVNLPQNTSGWVVKDFGANYFNEDWTFRFVCQYSNADAHAIVHFLTLANQDTGAYAIRNGASEDSDCFALRYYEDNGIEGAIYVDGASASLSTALSSSASTDYYTTVDWHYSGGANGTGYFVIVIRTGSHTGTVVLNTTLDCPTGEQNSYRYLYAMSNYENGAGATETDGVMDTLEMKPCL